VVSVVNISNLYSKQTCTKEKDSLMRNDTTINCTAKVLGNASNHHSISFRLTTRVHLAGGQDREFEVRFDGWVRISKAGMTCGGGAFAENMESNVERVWTSRSCDKAIISLERWYHTVRKAKLLVVVVGVGIFVLAYRKC
jgi:hypothetical protein